MMMGSDGKDGQSANNELHTMNKPNIFLAHEKLEVYEKALVFVRNAWPIIDGWSAEYAVRDQMDRACEGLVTNLVTASRLRRTERGRYYLECSFGSVLECAACLDVAAIRHLIPDPYLREAKGELRTIGKMESGLRASWDGFVHDGCDASGPAPDSCFPHETLRVYQAALQLCREVENRMGKIKGRRDRYARRIDEAATGMVLNIAEGNGRLSVEDHRHFVDIAEDAGSKLAAYLDLVAITSGVDVESVKEVLRQTMAMIAGMKGYLDGAER